VRLSFLDSIRGLAALIVLTSHLHASTRMETAFLELPVLRIFNAAVFAVSMFFVLSGFVLYLQTGNKRVDYFAFIVRRVFRIFPACIFVVTVSFLIYLAWSPGPSSSAFVNETTWTPGISFNSYLDHLWLGNDTSLLRPVWSLVIEWRVSLVFPLIVLLFRLSPLLTAAIATAVAFTVAMSPTPQVGFASIPMVVLYGCLFVIGIFIAAYRFHIVLFLRSRLWLRAALLAACFAHLFFRHESVDPSGFLIQGVLSGALIVVYLSTSQIRQLLRMKPLRYLGKISYSLYLVHMIWVGIFFRVLGGMNLFFIFAAVIIASIISADLLQRFIEAPFNLLGRQAASLTRLPILMRRLGTP
jgi:peptidoglycan/LPS O-acetylase OafA/YrhL